MFLLSVTVSLIYVKTGKEDGLSSITNQKVSLHIFIQDTSHEAYFELERKDVTVPCKKQALSYCHSTLSLNSNPERSTASPKKSSPINTQDYPPVYLETFFPDKVFTL